ncbi:MAG: cell division protein FtsH, partial [Pseudonocardia sp.]|nr:cell division protein FtsH [Pseudonocardia sp.]
DKPPIQTPAERAKERGEPWPPQAEPGREPTPVGSFPGGANGVPAAPHPGATHQVPVGQQNRAASGPRRPNSVPHNYGAPPDWRPATTPSGQVWPPAGQWQPPQQPPPQPWTQPAGTPHARPGNGSGHPGNGTTGSEPPYTDRPDGDEGSPSGGTDQGGSR